MRRGRPAFNRDSKREACVAEFLDSHLYPRYFLKSERVLDRERQLTGIDVICIHPEIDGEMLIDEKAATSWAHREIETFAFELSFLLYEKELEGWFLDMDKEKKSKTTHWLCVWPRTAGEQIQSVSDIVTAEAILIESQMLRRWARRMAARDPISLDSVMESLRGDSDKDEIQWAGLRVLISRGLPEKPINLLIPKDILRSLAGDMNWILP